MLNNYLYDFLSHVFCKDSAKNFSCDILSVKIEVYVSGGLYIFCSFVLNYNPVS